MFHLKVGHSIGLASGETFPKVGWIREEVMVVDKGSQKGAIEGDLWY